jgi:hypothetical protein
MPMCLRLLAMVSLLCLQHAAIADDHTAGPDDYRHHLDQLKAGDRLLLKAGDYTNGLPLQGLAGRAGSPIVIEGPATGPRARFIARSRANTVSLVDVQHLVIRNLELDGRDLPVDAVKAEGHARFAHHVTLENLTIHGHGNNQQIVGISTKCPARGWVIRNNVIEGAGTGIYLGNSDGSAPFWDGLVEHNRVFDSLGYNLQIKHQKARPAEYTDGARPTVTIIRNNYFRKSGNASTGKMARPNVLLGHLPLQGAGSDDRYLVYGNLFFNNLVEALFQAEGRVALYNNIFINPSGDAIRIQPHNDIPRDMEIFYNTVLASGSGIGIRTSAQDQPSYSQRVSGNVVAAARPVQGGEASHNLLLAYQPAMAVPEEVHRLTGDLMSRGQPSRKLPASLTSRYASYPNWNKDNEGKERNIAMPGATFSSAFSNWIRSGDETNRLGR